MKTVSLTRNNKETSIVTAFDYIYRDAGNFKSYGTVFLEGRLTSVDRQIIINTMESKEFFVAEQIPVPSLYSKLFEISGGRTSADHAWHSFSGFREVRAGTESNAIWGKAGNFVEAFRRVKQWDISLSPNYVM